jgi:predicted short-subunit dehydrogenase-like oxidoreductase (DUF2520 family)
VNTSLESVALRVGFVGAGKVACTLAWGLAAKGVNVRAAWSRQTQKAHALLEGLPDVEHAQTAQRVADACDLVFLTVSDDAIVPVCEQIAWRHGHYVVHCSGATELSSLAAAQRAGAVVGGFHPMQMFANPPVALKGLPGCAVGIEAEEPLLAILVVLAERLGCKPFPLPPGVRALYHASAYYVGPFLIALLNESVTLWKSFGAPERAALEALLPLLHGTVAAVQDGGLANGMGGCVARGDVGTVRKHLRELDRFSPAMGELYRELASRNIPLGIERGTLAPDRAAQIADALMGHTS